VGPTPAIRRVADTLPRGRTLPEAQFAVRHRVILRLLWVHVLLLPAVSLGYGYGAAHAAVEGLVIVPFAVLGGIGLPRRIRAVIAAMGLLTCSAVLVHITGGLIEAHFHFFVAVTILSLYEDWTVYGLAIAYVLLHHGMAASLLDEPVYNHAGDAWRWALVHTGFIGALCVANVAVWRAAERVRGELADANAALEQYAAVASHDLSEPLRVVDGYLTLLERRHGAELGPQGRELVARATQGTQRMRTLIDGLLAYSRVEQGPGSRAPVDLSSTVDATLAGLAAALEETHAEVRVDDLPVVEGDPVQLGQLFQNLLSNAVKFSNGHAPRVSVHADRQDGSWRFTVADNGVGLPPERAAEAFEMFGRVHSGDRYAGHGIGLAICRRIVDGHGGRIWVEPNPGGGSRFVFTLPD
jgi:signal transduction histidine kinase